MTWFPSQNAGFFFLLIAAPRQSNTRTCSSSLSLSSSSSSSLVISVLDTYLRCDLWGLGWGGGGGGWVRGWGFRVGDVARVWGWKVVRVSCASWCCVLGLRDGSSDIRIKSHIQSKKHKKTDIRAIGNHTLKPLSRCVASVNIFERNHDAPALASQIFTVACHLPSPLLPFGWPGASPGPWGAIEWLELLALPLGAPGS